MSKYKRVNQLGFVVDDMEKGLKEYAKIYEIKQWYRAGNTPKGETFFNGNPLHDDGFDLIIGYCGNTEIELISTKADASLYANFLKENAPGLHHVSFFVKNLDKAVKKFEKLGFEIVQSGIMNQKTMITDYAYMVKPGEKFGRIVELQATHLRGLRIPVIRSKWNLWLGAITGDAEKLDMKKYK